MKSDDKIENLVLQEIYYRTVSGGFIAMYSLEVELGLSGSELRSMLEDLKSLCYIVEHEEGFQLTFTGKEFSRSKWA